MLWNQIIGLSKFTGLFNAIKDLANSLTNNNNPHKYPIIYVVIVNIAADFLNINNLELWIAFFLKPYLPNRVTVDKNKLPMPILNKRQSIMVIDLN